MPRIRHGTSGRGIHLEITGEAELFGKLERLRREAPAMCREVLEIPAKEIIKKARSYMGTRGPAMNSKYAWGTWKRLKGGGAWVYVSGGLQNATLGDGKGREVYALHPSTLKSTHRGPDTLPLYNHGDLKASLRFSRGVVSFSSVEMDVYSNHKGAYGTEYGQPPNVPARPFFRPAIEWVERKGEIWRRMEKTLNRKLDILSGANEE